MRRRLGSEHASSMALHALEALGPGKYAGVHTIEQTATHLGISYDQVRRIECSALRKLRHHPAIQELALKMGLLTKRGHECLNSQQP